MKVGESIKESKLEFYEDMKKIIVSSLQYLKEKSKKEFLIDYDFKIDIDKRSWEIIPKFYSESFVIANIKEILNLPDAISCINFMLKNEFHKKLEMQTTDKNRRIVEDVEIYKEYLGSAIIGIFLKKYIDAEGKFDFNEVLFNQLYDELEEFVSTEGIEIIDVAPLVNFELKGIELIDLKDFVIRKLTEDEIKKILRHRPLGEILFLPHGGSLDTLWCIELRIKIPSKWGTKDLRPEIEKIITSLRLFKKGNLHYSAVLTYPRVWRTSWEISNYERRIVHGSGYELTNEDVKSLNAFWNNFKNLKMQNYSSLDGAIRRFNFSYDRRLPEDKLIDFIVASEGLFRPGEEGELKYSLALRCAYFLGNDGKERKKIFEIIKGAYEVRNKIVHGGEKSINKILNKLNIPSLTELSMQVEEYLRDSINRFLNSLQSKSDNEIREEIKEKIIVGA